MLEVMLVSIEIGSYLKEAREALGITLEQLQEMTKIQKSFIIAIENGEFQKLPSPFYVRTYLRSYANCVKVEPHHILRQYRKEEQAERGLTGTHKIVNEDILQSSITTENKIIEEQRKRVTTTMALTIAKTRDARVNNNDLLSQDKNLRELTRRSVGYQGADYNQESHNNTKANVYSYKSSLGLTKTNQEVSTWSSPQKSREFESVPESKQNNSHLTGIPPILKRSTSKRKKSKGSKFVFLMCIGILSVVGGLAWFLYKSKFF